MASPLEMVSWVVVNLVDHPDDVRVRRLERDGGEIFEVHVHPEDLGQVIGKGGATAKSVRTLLEAMGKRSGKAYGFEIADEDVHSEGDADAAPAAEDATA